MRSSSSCASQTTSWGRGKTRVLLSLSRGSFGAQVNNMHTDRALPPPPRPLDQNLNEPLLRWAESIINPRRACPARVTVLGLCVCVRLYSRTTGNYAAYERYQQLQCNKRSKIKQAILLKRQRSRARNWHCQGPRCVAQPIN